MLYCRRRRPQDSTRVSAWNLKGSARLRLPPFQRASDTLDNGGHRTSVTEKSGRTVNYSYDNLYRLTNETVASDPNGMNSSIAYAYDPVGNRTQQTSLLPGMTSGGFGYDAHTSAQPVFEEAMGPTGRL
jgi:YD repeat-containing protein